MSYPLHTHTKIYIYISHNNKANSKEKQKNTCSGDTPSSLDTSIIDSSINFYIPGFLV